MKRMKKSIPSLFFRREFYIQKIQSLISEIEKESASLLIPLPHQVDETSDHLFQHPFPEIFHQISGTTTFILPKESIILQPGSFLLMPPGVHHLETAIADTSKRYEMMVLQSREDLAVVILAKKDRQKSEPQLLTGCIYKNLESDLFSLFSILLERVSRTPLKKEMKNLLLRSALDSILHAVSFGKKVDSFEDPEQEVFFKKYSEILADVHSLKSSLKTLSSKFNMSPSYISVCFKKYCGMGFNQYLQRRRLEMAKKNLLQTDDKLEKIAENCGFSSANYLVRSFRSTYKMTPAHFRRKCREDGMNLTSDESRASDGSA